MIKKHNKIVFLRLPYTASELELYPIDCDSSTMEKTIDRQISKLKRRGVSMEDCKAYLNSLVDEYFTMQIAKLERSRSGLNGISSNHYIQRKADKEALKDALNALELKISETEAEYKAVKDLYSKYNPLSNGRLTEEAEHVPE